MIKSIADKRNVFAEALNLLTVASKLNCIRTVETRSIGCSAFSSKSDEEWDTALSSSAELYHWWSSVELKRLHKISQEKGVPAGQCHTSAETQSEPLAILSANQLIKTASTQRQD